MTLKGKHMLKGKERSELKKLAQSLRPAAMIGRAGVTETVIASIDEYLAANELIKVQIQEGADVTAEETANMLAERLHAEFVQAIGRRFILYRRARDPKKRKIFF